MEILIGLVVVVVLNALSMAEIMRWQAKKIRHWSIKPLESVLVQARATFVAAACAVIALYGLAYLGVGAKPMVGVAMIAFFALYYYTLRYAAYALTKHQRDRGRGVARRHVKDIANATFTWMFGVYAMFAGLIVVVSRMAGGE